MDDERRKYTTAIVVWSELRQCIREYFRDYNRVLLKKGFSDQDAIDTAEANYSYAINCAVADIAALDQDMIDWLWSGPLQEIK